MFKRDDWIFGVIATAVGSAALYLTKDLGTVRSIDSAGPRMFPLIVSSLMIAIGVAHILGAWLVRRRLPADSEEKKKENGSIKHVILICIACGVYCLLLESVGYLIMTPLLIIAIMMSVGERKIGSILTTTVVVSAFLFCVFYYALNVRIPLGILETFFR